MGDGQDVIAAVYDEREGKANRLVLDPEVAPNDISFRKINRDLLIQISPSDAITVKYYFGVSDEIKESIAPVQIIQMPDGTEWNYDKVVSVLEE